MANTTKVVLAGEKESPRGWKEIVKLFLENQKRGKPVEIHCEHATVLTETLQINYYGREVDFSELYEEGTVMCVLQLRFSSAGRGLQCRIKPDAYLKTNKGKIVVPCHNGNEIILFL